MTSPRLRYNILTIGTERFVLRNQELEFLLLMQIEPVVAHEMIASKFWSDARPATWRFVIRKVASSVRKKLNKGGWDIRFLRGTGYVLDRLKPPASAVVEPKRSTNGWKYMRR